MKMRAEIANAKARRDEQAKILWGCYSRSVPCLGEDVAGKQYYAVWGGQ